MRTVIVGWVGARAVGDHDCSRERLAEADVGMASARGERPRKLKTGIIINQGLTHGRGNAVDCGEAWVEL